MTATASASEDTGGVIRVTQAYVRMRSWFDGRFGSEDGATAVEYALMVALIALVIVSAVTLLGHATSSKFSDPTLVAGLGG